MSTSSKKVQLHTLENTLANKITGRNHKSNLNNNNSNFIIKTNQNQTNATNQTKINTSNNNPKTHMVDAKSSLYNKGNLNANINQTGNKINIKISVNYVKQQPNLKYINTNNSQNSIRKKSLFSHSSFNNTENNTFINSVKEENLNNSQILLNKNTEPIPNKKPSNKSVKSTLNYENFMRSKIIEKENIKMKTNISLVTNTTTDRNLNHKRNKSENSCINNVSISLTNVEAKPIINSYSTTSKSLNQTNSFVFNNKLTNNYNTKSPSPIKKEYVKLCDSSSRLNNINKDQLIILENKLEEMITSIQLDEKEKLSAVSKKFSIYKKIFDEFIKLFTNSEEFTMNILMKISEGFNDTMNDLIKNSNKLQERNNEYDNLSNSKIIFY